VSPWSFEGVSKETFGWSSIAWLTFTALAASGLGGYLAGRLRTKWTQIHGDETYFRDTAHGFVSWAVATLLTAGLLTSAIGGVLARAQRWPAPPPVPLRPRPALLQPVPAALPRPHRKATSTIGWIRCSAARPTQGRPIPQRRRRARRWTRMPRRRRHRAPVRATRAWPRRRDRCRATVRSATAAKCVPK
jgi:hypothetical protein